MSFGRLSVLSFLGWAVAGAAIAVEAGPNRNEALRQILAPGAGWELAAAKFRTTDGPAVDPSGTVYFDDGAAGHIYRIDAAGCHVWLSGADRHAGEAFGPDGRLYGFVGTDTLAAFGPDGPHPIVSGLDRANDLAIAHDGNIYISADPPAGAPPAASKVWLVRPDGSKRLVDTGLKFANGITLSPDQTQLYVDDSRSRRVYSYVIAADGTLRDKQPFVTLAVGDTDADTAADGMRVDREGRLYVTTRLGIQVCDGAGRVSAILAPPNGKVSNLTFGGKNFDVLYATCGDRVFRRRLNVQGANAWAEPNLPSKPQP